MLILLWKWILAPMFKLVNILLFLIVWLLSVILFFHPFTFKQWKEFFESMDSGDGNLGPW